MGRGPVSQHPPDHQTGKALVKSHKFTIYQVFFHPNFKILYFMQVLNPQFNRFASNRENVKSQMPNFYHSSI